MNQRFNQIIQIGIIVPDAPLAAHHLKTILGWQPRAIWETSRVPGRLYNGEEEDFACKMIFYEFPNIEIEIIQPFTGRSCWQDFLNNHGPGIHHLLFDIDESVKTEAELLVHGIYTLQRGRALPYGENVYWAYMSTQESLGFTVEITNRREYPITEVSAPVLVQGPFCSPEQVGIIVRHAEAVSKRWQSILGWRPTNEAAVSHSDCQSNHGSVLSYTYSFPHIAVVLSQPLSGLSFEKDRLESDGEGIHYIQFSIRDESEINSLLNHGIRVIREGTALTNGKQSHFVYLDTLTLFGFYLKISIN